MLKVMTPLWGTKHSSRARQGQVGWGKKPPGRHFPARCGAAWSGYGAAWAAWGAPSRCPRNILTSNTAFRVFTKHETRDPAIAKRAARGALWAGANSEVFTKHETRNTNHGLFQPRICRIVASWY